MPKVSSVKREKGKITYRGKSFPGFNKPVKSTRPGKKGMVLAKKGNEFKLVHFGSSSAKQNTSASKRKAFMARHSKIKNKSGKKVINDKFSPSYWSARKLWPKGKRGTSLK